jgi:hypothetical protein
MNKGGLIGEQLQRQTAKTAKGWTEILNVSLGLLRLLLN